MLCLQDDIAERTLAMLKGAVAELAVGNPDSLATDVGPVITDAARDGIMAHIDAMRRAGRRVHRLPLPPDCAQGSFVPPTIIEIESLAELRCEVFGPVLHVLRFPRGGVDALIDAVNATGYGLTFGIHTRIDETIARATARAGASNIYVNRNLIGAVVGVQPFGGHGLSGTGPKAGGPLYLRRLLAARPAFGPIAVGVDTTLPGPVGEDNRYRLEPRGTVLCRAASESGLQRQREAVQASGNRAVTDPAHAADAILFEGDAPALLALCQSLASRPGAIVPVHVAGADGLYPVEFLVQERSISTNTTAAGGNANLMMIA